MKKLILTISFLSLLFACSKDKFQSTPSIRIKSINTTNVPVNGNLDVVLTYTDKEGDVSDSIFIRKLRLNSRVVPTKLDSLGFSVPDFPSNSKGDIEVNLDYETIKSAINPPQVPGSNPPQYESDTLILKFVLEDKAGHKSDTLTTDKIIVHRVQ